MKLNDESGIVLFFVLMTAIIIMIFSLSVLTQSMNEINYAQQQIDQATCQQLVKGKFWQAQSSGTLPVTIPSITINGRTYSFTTSGVGTSNWKINCTYNTL
jgi:hypothetical protein